MAAKRRRKKRIHKGKFIRFIILVLLFVGGIISLFLYAPFFNVSEVIVTGNSVVSSEDIVKSSGIVLGTNVFKVGKNDVSENVKKISRIDDVVVKKKLPKKVNIEVKETYERMIIPYMSGYLLVNEAGKVIEMKDDVSKNTLPMIEGIKVKDAKVCEMVVAEDELTFDIVLECVYELLDKDVLKTFKTVDFSNITNFSGYTVDGVKVIFGKMTDLEYKVKVLADVMPRVEKIEGAYIDLSTPSATFYGNLQNEPQKEEKEEETQDGKSKEEETDKEETDKKKENDDSKDEDESNTNEDKKDKVEKEKKEKSKEDDKENNKKSDKEEKTEKSKKSQKVEEEKTEEESSKKSETGEKVSAE